MKNIDSCLASAVLAIIYVSATGPALAHHSDAGMDTESILAFDGTVTEFAFRNPHVYIGVEVAGGNGEAVEWALQMGTANGLARRGWTGDTLRPGDSVSLRVHPALDGRPYGLVESVDKEGGLGLATPTSGETPQQAARATSLAGRWRADGAKLIRYPGGFDGFFHANLELTEEALAAQAAYDPLSSENPESTCIGRPTPAALASTRLYLIEFEINEEDQTIFIRSEYFDEERTIYMDGRAHPGADARFATGHSIGWWEGDTLVLDTTNFTDHRSPYQIGVPSGPQKHVVERYRLIENGSRMEAEFTLQDPQYLAEPFVHQRELIYSPHETMYRFNCDPRSTGRFVR